nr:hypothetical protein [Tanacetum cinerariifolium]
RGDALRSLDYMREMVVCDSATLGELFNLPNEFEPVVYCDSCIWMLMINLSKNRGLIAELEALRARVYAVRALGNMREIVARDVATLELEALRARVDAVRALGNMREIVARDVATLDVLEQLLADTHAVMRLKDGYLAEIEE